MEKIGPSANSIYDIRVSLRFYCIDKFDAYQC